MKEAQLKKIEERLDQTVFEFDRAPSEQNLRRDVRLLLAEVRRWREFAENV